MKIKPFIRFLLFFTFLIFITISCRKETPESVRSSEERAVTITNNTENRILGYKLNAGKNGTEIEKGPFESRSIATKISDAWKNDPDLEIELVDVYNNIYRVTVNVPLHGNTDVIIGPEHKISQGFLKDLYNKLVEWLNRNK